MVHTIPRFRRHRHTALATDHSQVRFGVHRCEWRQRDWRLLVQKACFFCPCLSWTTKPILLELDSVCSSWYWLVPVRDLLRISPLTCSLPSATILMWSLPLATLLSCLARFVVGATSDFPANIDHHATLSPKFGHLTSVCHAIYTSPIHDGAKLSIKACRKSFAPHLFFQGGVKSLNADS